MLAPSVRIDRVHKPKFDKKGKAAGSAGADGQEEGDGKEGEDDDEMKTAADGTSAGGI